MDDNPNRDEDKDSKPVCPCCLENPGDIHVLQFCGHCGAPIGGLAATNPFERIFAEGYTYRAAVEHPRKLITVVGIWVLFAPSFLFGWLVWLGEPGGFFDLIAFFTGIASIVLVFRVTRNYVRYRSLGR